MLCDGKTPARKRYERGVLRQMAAYLVVILCSSWFVKHDGGERFYLYFWSIVPAIPIVGVVLGMAKYLRDETDEFQKQKVMRSILVGTASLLVAVVVNDFLRAFAKADGLPPFLAYLIFMAGMAIAEFIQWLRYRVRDDEK